MFDAATLASIRSGSMVNALWVIGILVAAYLVVMSIAMVLWVYHDVESRTVDSFTRALACDTKPEHFPCMGDTVDVILWDDILRAEGGGWSEVRMPHGGRLRVVRVPRTASLRVREGLGVEIAR